MSFEPVVFGRSGEVFVTIDKYYRLMLSSSARNKLALNDLVRPWISVYYDKGTHRIAIQKLDLVKATAHDTSTTKVDNRGYFNAKPIIRAAAIDGNRLPIRYYYDGDVSIEGQTYLSFKLREVSE